MCIRDRLKLVQVSHIWYLSIWFFFLAKLRSLHLLLLKFLFFFWRRGQSSKMRGSSWILIISSEYWLSPNPQHTSVWFCLQIWQASSLRLLLSHWWKFLTKLGPGQNSVVHLSPLWVIIIKHYSAMLHQPAANPQRVVSASLHFTTLYTRIRSSLSFLLLPTCQLLDLLIAKQLKAHLKQTMCACYMGSL